MLQQVKQANAIFVTTSIANDILPKARNTKIHQGYCMCKYDRTKLYMLQLLTWREIL